MRCFETRRTNREKEVPLYPGGLLLQAPGDQSRHEVQLRLQLFLSHRQEPYRPAAARSALTGTVPLYIKRIDVEKAKAAKQSVKAVPENRRPGSPIWEPLALQLYKDGKNDSQIAEACGVPRHNIANWRYRRNLPGQPDANKTRQRTYLPKRTFDEKKALALYKAGKFDREIAEAVTVSPQTIQRWRKACGLQSHVPSQNSGKAPDYDWVEALALYEKGFSDRAIAKELGCAPQTVNSWRRRENLPNKYKLKLEGRNG
jgi:transposase